MGERLVLDFRVEIWNLLNRAILNTPNLITFYSLELGHQDFRHGRSHYHLDDLAAGRAENDRGDGVNFRSRDS